MSAPTVSLWLICSSILISPMLITVPTEAGPNLGTHLPLHAVINPPAPPCDIGDPCSPGSPTVSVPVGSTIHAYVLVRNYEDVGALQTAFDWGDWIFVAGSWSCQVGQVCGTEPHGNGGPEAGTIATAFNCITGGETAVIGFMRLVALTPGCLSQVESSFPLGTCVVSCSGEVTPIDAMVRGSICAGQPGVDACEPAVNGVRTNQAATLPLHAIVIPGTPPPDPCVIVDPCDPGPPLVNVPLGTTIDAYLLARHYDNLIIVQTAFAWEGWTYLGSAWNCQSGQITGHEPYGNGGPAAGTITTLFDCITGGQSAILGYMRFVTDGPGCLTQVESSFPYGNHVVSCADQIDPIDLLDCGSICVDAGGIDACATALQSPVCDAGGPYYATLGVPVELDGTGSFDPDGTIVSYAWEFGDGGTGSGPTTTHTYLIENSYTVTLCVTDNDSLESCCTTTVWMDGSTPVELASFAVTCADGQVQLEWRTTSELAGQRFDLFRRELDQANSAKINVDEIDATGSDRSRYTFIDRNAAVGHTFEYRLESIDPVTGRRETAGILRVTVAGHLSRRLVLHQNRPNPFNPSSTIVFELPAAGRVSLRLYDASGRLVRTLLDGVLARGRHDVEWSGNDELGRAVGSGIYIYRLESGETSLTRRMVLLR